MPLAEFLCKSPASRLARALLGASIFAIAGVGPSVGATLLVPDEYESIPEAFQGAGEGDTVVLAPGSYLIDEEENVRFPAGGVTLLSEVPGEATVYFGFGVDYGLTINHPGCAIHGVDFVAVDFPTNHLFVSGSNADLENCTFEGGWLGIDNISDGLEIRDCTITGVRAGIANLRALNTLVSGCSFSGTSGAVYVGYGSIRIIGNEFANNGPSGDSEGVDHLQGAAIRAIDVAGGLEIRGNLFRDNTAFSSDYEENDAKGGAVFILGCIDADVRENTFLRNRASRGGGLFCENSSASITENLFIENEAARGSGIGGGILVIDPFPVVMARNTVDANTALAGGSGIHIQSGNDWQLMHSIITNGSGGEGGVFSAQGAPPVVECNDVWNNATADYVGFADPTGQDGNISADPIFCSDESRTLDATSPCAEATCGLIGARPVGCGTSAVSEMTTPSMGQLDVFPNPARGPVTIRLRDANTVMSYVEVFNVAGQRVDAAPVPGGSKAVTVGTANLSAGIYLVRASNGAEGRVVVR